MGKFITRLYEYDSTQEANAYRGTDYSRYILMGDNDKDNLDDTLDSVEITLAGLPFREEFAPSSKFIYEKWEVQLKDDGTTIETLWKDWHLCVANDTVEQPILSDDEYFNHNISFYEASVEAQKRIVDNISVTYRLQDVTLNVQPTYDVNALASIVKTDVNDTPTELFGYSSGFIWYSWKTGHSFRWVMPNWYQVTLNGVTKTPEWSDWKNLKLNEEIPIGQASKIVEIPTPMLECWCAVGGTIGYRKNGLCSIDVIVEETSVLDSSSSIVQSFTVNPADDTAEENAWQKDDVARQYVAEGFGEIVSRYVAVAGNSSLTYTHDTYKSCVAVKEATKTNRKISITIRNGYKYRVIVKRHSFPSMPAPLTADFYDEYPAIIAKGDYISRFLWADLVNASYFTNDNLPLASISFFGVEQGSSTSIIFKNAPPATALQVYTKAQLSSQSFYRQEGLSVDNTIVPYYLEDADKQELENTSVVENFYNQKNFWEVQMDIGKYIHARPKIRFGSNNRFKTTWKKYGLTTQYEDNSVPVSIYNSRFIEEYVSACSSYVANMVQLGGIITEIVAPKSSSDDYLVYNDVAELIVEKPIIEILKVEAIKKVVDENDNVTWATRDITNNVFEESVYNILSINANDSVNKGLAIYYTLGTNKIVGLQYQLPAQNQGDPQREYAIKRILGNAFALGDSNIKINDFLFRISYRTKDSLRADQTRPDLRKYLLSTPYDRVPQHNQFNNQTDVVADSIKFGNNVYGKLIRTGNSVFTKLEWVDSLFSLKQSGELYTIDGNLYYVSKVSNTYYEDHIESEVEFSKDFNRLSQIIGIPSEPRFYEISERNIIDREVVFDDYLVLGTSTELKPRGDNFVKNGVGMQWVKGAIFGEHSSYPKYAITVFKNDKEKETALGNELFKVETCHPVCSYSIENTLSVEWDMADNFSAGDQVGETSLSIPSSNPTNTAYYTLKPFQYVDVYGRCDLLDFAIVEDVYELDTENPSFNNLTVLNLPRNPVDLTTAQNILFTSAKETSDYENHEKGLIVLKDARETLKFNYNLQILTDSDRFVLSSYIWQQNKENLRIGLLSEEINKLSNATITNRAFAITEIPFNTTVETSGTAQGIKVAIYDALTSFATSEGKTLSELLSGIKAIVIYSTNEINNYVNDGAKYFVCGRNIGGLTTEEASKDWYVNYLDKSLFKSQ